MCTLFNNSVIVLTETLTKEPQKIPPKKTTNKDLNKTQLKTHTKAAPVISTQKRGRKNAPTEELKGEGSPTRKKKETQPVTLGELFLCASK